MGLRFKVSGNQIIPIGDLDRHRKELEGLGFEGTPLAMKITETFTKAGQYENISR